MNGVPPDIMRIRRSAGTSHNALNVLQTNNKPTTSAHALRTQRSSSKGFKEKNTHEGVNQHGIIKSPNPSRIQRLVVENINPLQKSQRLQPLQPSRLSNVRWDFSGLSSLTEHLRGGMTRLASGGKRERAGGCGCRLFRPDVQTRRGPREAEDVGEHFWLGVCDRGERATWWGGMACVCIRRSSTESGGWEFCHVSRDPCHGSSPDRLSAVRPGYRMVARMPYWTQKCK